MLVLNGSKLAGVGRMLGAPSYLVQQQSNWYHQSAIVNFYAGQGTVVGGASIANTSAFPGGYTAPATWVLAIKAGGMASRGRIQGDGGLTAANLAGGLSAEAAVDGAGDLTNAALTLLFLASASLSGSGSLSADVTGKLDAAASLLGSGDITAAITALAEVVAAITGTGDLSSADILGGLLASASITGTGEITNAALGLVVSAIADLLGSGEMTAGITGKLEAAAALSGSGDLTAAALAALADLVAAITGTGAIDPASLLRGVASMSADIVVSGDLLNSANVGAAVWEHAIRTLTSGSGGSGATAAEIWQYALENGYTAEELIRIITAAVSGLSSGAVASGASTYRFRDIADTKDRIISDTDGVGNRTAVVLDGSA